jgi:hypothetical protein
MRNTHSLERRENLRVIQTKAREACAPKDLEKGAIRSAFKEFLKWRLVFQQWSGQPID